jgi:hypothetical protein
VSNAVFGLLVNNGFPGADFGGALETPLGRGLGEYCGFFRMLTERFAALGRGCGGGGLGSALTLCVQ